MTAVMPLGALGRRMTRPLDLAVVTIRPVDKYLQLVTAYESRYCLSSIAYSRADNK